MNAVILGATKGMGRALARKMAERGDALFLLGRRPLELAKTAEDLRVRGRGPVIGYAECDLLEPEGFASALEKARQSLGIIDAIVVTAGLFATQDALEGDLELAQRVLTADFTNTVVFCEHARRILLEGGGGTLAVFSSVAGERGRKPVILYGASKAGLSAYLEGLDHKYRARGLRVVTVKPGFVKTSMTASLKAPPFAGEPNAVADAVLRAIDRGSPVVYAPIAWAPIMGVIRLLPRFVMRRVAF